VGVEVVVGDRQAALVETDDERIVEVLHVQDPRPGLLGNARCLVHLVVHQNEALVLREPSLVGIDEFRSRQARQGLTVRLVLHIHDVAPAEATEGKRDFLAVVVRVGSGVDHNLRIVDIEFVPCTGQRGIGGVGYVHDVQAAIEGVRAHTIDEIGLGIGGHVVCTAESGVEGQRSQRGHGLHGGHLRQVHDLHAVFTGFAYDVRHIADHLDVPPETGHRRGGHIGDHGRIDGVGDLHDGGAVAAAEEHEFPILGGPAPAVVAVARGDTAELLE